MADWFSLPTALLSVSVLAALAGVVAWTTRRAGEAPAPQTAAETA